MILHEGLWLWRPGTKPGGDVRIIALPRSFNQLLSCCLEKTDFCPKLALFSQLQAIFVPQLIRGSGSRSEMTEWPSSTWLQLNYSGRSNLLLREGGVLLLLWDGCGDGLSVGTPSHCRQRSFLIHLNLVRCYLSPFTAVLF